MADAARHDIRLAKILLGEMHCDGVGCPVDIDLAVQCWASFKFSILQHSKRDRDDLAKVGCLKTFRAQDASQIEYAEPLFTLGTLYNRISFWADWPEIGEFLEVARSNAAFTCLQLAASAGHIRAKYELGMMHILGGDIFENEVTGLRCIREAADAGIAEAIQYLRRRSEDHSFMPTTSDRK
jgi:TPR repeat protein